MAFLLVPRSISVLGVRLRCVPFSSSTFLGLWLVVLIKLLVFCLFTTVRLMLLLLLLIKFFLRLLLLLLAIWRTGSVSRFFTIAHTFFLLLLLQILLFPGAFTVVFLILLLSILLNGHYWGHYYRFSLRYFHWYRGSRCNCCYGNFFFSCALHRLMNKNFSLFPIGFS